MSAQPRARIQVFPFHCGAKGVYKAVAGAGVEHQPPHRKIDGRVPCPGVTEINDAGH
jgi:hypothetical protein